MDSRFKTQAGLYEILEQADAAPGVLDVSIGRWLAWPAIKVLIYARFFNALDEAPMATASTKRVFRGASLGSRLPATWLRLRAALSRVPARSDRPRVAWMTGSYARKGPDGVERDALFADLPRELASYAEELWLLPPLISDAASGVHAESLYAVATDWANQLSSLQRFRPAVRAAADQLAGGLASVTSDAAGLTWNRVCRDALSTFEARRMAWTRVFTALRPDAVFMTNAPYLTGEVAAARTCGIAVAEFQHGLFGPRCPEYGWPGALASKRAQVPVADRLFVFGDLFRDGALKNGFWRPEDVRAIGSAAIERQRREARPSALPGAATRVVFLTQPATRAEAIAFWRRFLAGVQSGAWAPATLTIKVHPSERERADEYAMVAKEFPSLCRLAGADEDAGRVMLDHDLVTGFTSYGLIEAVGLGRPAVSISSEQSPGGVFALCPVPGAEDAIPTVSSPAELSGLMARPAARASQASGFFSPQSPGTLLQASLELLRTSRPGRAA